MVVVLPAVALARVVVVVVVGFIVLVSVSWVSVGWVSVRVLGWVVGEGPDRFVVDVVGTVRQLVRVTVAVGPSARTVRLVCRDTSGFPDV